MKYIVLWLLLLSVTLQAQTNLKFDTRLLDSQDKWVSLPMGKDSTYSYGFVYLDTHAGLTFQPEGSFKISAAGELVSKKLPQISVTKIRIQPTKLAVAVISADKFKDLQIEAVPQWLKIYKTDSASAQRHYQLGFTYNAWGECAKALSFLETAEKADPKIRGLQTEFAFSYNCLGQFDKAVSILNTALQANPADAYTHKELIFAQIKMGRLDDASESLKRALSVCKDTTYHAENSYNLLHSYFVKKDKSNFQAWLTETKKWTANNPRLTMGIKGMEEQMAK